MAYTSSVRWLLLAAAMGCARVASEPSTTLVEARFGATLTRTAWIAQGNHHPVTHYFARGRDLGEGLYAALTPKGFVIVRGDGTLDGDVRARDVLPDLAVSDDGKVAYVALDGLHLHDQRGDRKLVSAFSDADRPIFLDDRTLAFVGAAKPGVSTFYRLDLATETPTQLSIPAIPATRDGYRVENGVIHFFDGAKQW
jgi:hypothetical protein